MKKLFYVMALVGAVVLTSCEGVTNETPANSSTQLWPAYNSASDLYGYIDAKGEWAIPAQFSSASSFFSAGYAVVKINGNSAFIDTKGNVQKCVSFDAAAEFKYGYSRASLNQTFGLISTNFEYAIQPAYPYLGEMTNDGLVTYQPSSDKYGFLNANGQVLMKEGAPLFFESADDFRDGYCVVSSNLSTENDRIPTYAFIDTKGEASIAEGAYMYMENMGLGIAGAVNKDKDATWPYEYHLLKADGSSLIGSIYNDVDPFSADKYAAVMREESNKSKWGYIDANGKEVVTPNYSQAQPTNEGYGWVLDEETWMLLDIKSNRAAITLSQIKAGDIEERPLCGVHNGLTLVCKTTYSSTGDPTIEYRWIDVKKNNTVYSWRYNVDKMNGGLKPSNWAPARAEKAEFSEYVFLQ